MLQICKEDHKLNSVIMSLIQTNKKNNAKSFSINKQSSMDNKNLFCVQCKVHFQDIADLESHWNQLHNSSNTKVNLERYFCHYCNKAFLTESDIEFHRASLDHQKLQEKIEKKDIQQKIIHLAQRFEFDEIITLISNYQQKIHPRINLEDS